MIYKAYIFSLKKGIFVYYLDEKRLGRFKQKRIPIIYKREAKLSKREQLNFLAFINLTYISGQNLEMCVREYSSICPRQLKTFFVSCSSLLKQGIGIAVVMKFVFDKKIQVIMSLADKSGDWDVAFQEGEDVLTENIAVFSQIVSKLMYPVLLFLSVVGMVFVVAAFLVPQFKNYYTSFNSPIPVFLKILTVPNLIGLFIGLLMVIVVFFIVYRICPVSVLFKIPLLKRIKQLQFQQVFFILYRQAIVTNTPLGDVIEYYLKIYTESVALYYLSSIFLMLKQGKSMQSVFHLPCFNKKYGFVAGKNISTERMVPLLEKIIKDNQLQQRNAVQAAINVFVTFTLILVGGLVLLLGYIMMSPLSSLVDFI